MVVMVALAGLVRAEDDSEDSAVKILTDANAAEMLASGKWLLKLYAPWCGHCKRLAPTWDELAVTAGEEFNVGKIDCTVHETTCRAFNIQGYPTVKFIDGENMYDYRGQRTVDDFLAFARTGYADAKKSATPSLGGGASAEHDEL